MNWKKRIRKIAILYLIFVVFFYVVLLVENRFGYVKEEVVSLNTPAILEQVPEIEITDADRSMMEKLSQYAAATGLPDGGETAVLENGEVSAIVGECLSREEMASALVGTYSDGNRNILSLYWKQENDMPVYLEMTRRGSKANYYKETGEKGFLSGGSIYKNWDNTGAMETAVRRRWFAWIWEGLNWE